MLRILIWILLIIIVKKFLKMKKFLMF
jgi:hypothetical protein